MLYAGMNLKTLLKPIEHKLFRWSYMLQIEECQVKIQYKSHLIEFQHHIEEVQRFFISQVNLKTEFLPKENSLFL